MGKIKKNIAVIGAGAAGLIAASIAKKDYINVDLYEKNALIGKKILISGNGRCNISNADISQNDYCGEDISFVKQPMENFGFRKLKKFCMDMGLLLDIKEDKRVYPLSNEAKSVVFAFENLLNELGVNIITNTAVSRIQKSNDVFFIYKNEGKINERYDSVLLSSGCRAAPQLGADESGLNIAESFGHTINKPYPSLVPLEINSNICRRMDGVKCKAGVSLYVNRRKIQEVYGDILFTKYGISGFAILDISIAASLHLSKKSNVTISVNLLPQIERQFIDSLIRKAACKHKSFTILDILCGILPYKIARALLYEFGIETEMKAHTLTEKLIKTLTHKMFDWRFDIASTHGFKYAEACGGGVKTSEIDNKTMESKIVKGLYFAGEIIDIVGKRGGYNLAFSFASGYSAGKNMII